MEGLGKLKQSKPADMEVPRGTQKRQVRWEVCKEKVGA